MLDEKAQQKKAQAQVAAIVKDGKAEINGNEYVFLKTTHRQRLKVFAYFTSVKELLGAGNFSFLDTREWDAIEAIIRGMVTFGGDSLKVRGDDHWEEFHADYLKFISVAMPVICYPFMSAAPTS